MQEPKNILVRAGLIYVAVALMALGIVASIIVLQFNTPLKEEGKEIPYKWKDVDARRGDILACDGRPLVTSELAYALYIDATVAQDSVFKYEVAALSEKLANLFGDKSASDYEKQLREARRDKKYCVRFGSRTITFNELQQVKQYPMLSTRWRSKTRDGYGGRGGGCMAEEEEFKKIIRRNFYNKIAFRTLGWQNQDGSYVGLEGRYDYALKGVAGKQLVQKTAGGIFIPVSDVPEKPPRNGNDLVSTIDIDMQDAAETALRRQLSVKHGDMVFEAGCAVVMEVQTGAIRAIANLKRNPDGSYSEDYNYAVRQTAEAGSTFKLYTLIALLEDGKVSLEDEVDTGNGELKRPGFTFKDVKKGGYGKISVQQAFEKSSNVGFALLAENNYKGNERQFVDRLYAMKLNEKMDLQIPGEGEQFVRYPTDKSWSKLSLQWLSMGYEAELTPLKTLTMYNAVANNGRMMKPLFATELRDGGRTVETFPPEVISSAICSQATLQKVRQALEGVVARGTATNIRDTTYYKIAGKTGTARLAFGKEGYEQIKGGLKYHKYQASFAGYFPADQPKYSMVVVLYSEPTTVKGIYGATWAAPVFKEIADKIYINSPEWAEEVKPLNTSKTSNLLGLN